MAEKLYVEILTPCGDVFCGEADDIVAPGELGELNFLPEHASFLTKLKFGKMSYLKDGQRSALIVSEGFAEVVDNKVTILVDYAERPEEIDLDRAKAALKRAEERGRQVGREDIDFDRIAGALYRALVRIELVGSVE
ncbi:MAG: F0F1 ATP synthase subunit epsilon [Thermodesulfobacteriota bacterium]|nr:F0F1 ATP synthase subunit epsilon [Thermodesulfobacteriota bacterium]